MNPIIEEWFLELDEGDEELRSFIRQVSDAVVEELRVPPSLIEYLNAHNLALVPTSRLWWENPPIQMFSAVRPRSLAVPPGREERKPDDLDLPGKETESETSLDEVEEVDVRSAFFQGALEGIAIGQQVTFLTNPSGPMHQQDSGVGIVKEIHGMRIFIEAPQGRTYEVDLDRGGKITLRR